MSFYEDERIRSKNALHNLAYEEYSRLKDGGLSDSDISQLCLGHIAAWPTSARNDIYSTIVKIVGGYRDAKSSN